MAPHLKRSASLSLAIALALSLAVVGPAGAGENKWTSQGPFGGKVKALAVNSTTNSNIFAGVDGNGVYRSDNGGISWTSYGTSGDEQGLTDLRVQDLELVEELTPALLFVATNGGGIFRRADGDPVWTEINVGVENFFVLSLVSDPDFPDKDTIYAGTNGGGVFKSIDRGDTWAEANFGLGQRVIFDLQIPVPLQLDLVINEVDAQIGDTDPTETMEFVELFGPPNLSLDGKILVLFDGEGPEFPPGCPNPMLSTIGVNPAYFALDLDGLSLDPNGFFVIGDAGVPNVDLVPADDGYGSPGLFLQNDITVVAIYRADAEDFTLPAYPLPAPPLPFDMAGTSAHNNNLDDVMVYDLGTFEDTCLLSALGLLVQNNENEAGGEDFHSNSRDPDGGTPIDSGNFIPQIPTPGLRNRPIDTIYATTDLNGVYRSDDRAVIWVPVNNELAFEVAFTMAIDGAVPVDTVFGCELGRVTVYVGTSNGGVYRGTNPCDLVLLDDWEQINNGLTDLTVLSLAFAPPIGATPSMIYAGTETGKVFRLVSGTSSWDEVSNGLEGLFTDSLDVDASAPNIVYAGTLGGGVFKTIDSAANWFQSGPDLDGLSGVFSEAVEVDPIDPLNVYAGTFGGGIFVSGDGGLSWTPSNTGIPFAFDGASRFVLSLALDSTDPTVLYAGTDLDGLFKSTDSGATWTAMNTGLPADISVLDIKVDPLTPSTVYATTGDIYKSTDGAGSWTAMNTGFPADTTVLNVTIDPLTPTTVYAGTLADGLFTSADGAGTWTALNNGLTESFIRTLTVDPADSTALFAGTDGGGIFKTIDAGNVWSPTNNGLENLIVLRVLVDTEDSSVLYAGTDGGGVFKSRDGGANWSEFNPGLGNPFILDMEFNPQDTDLLYAGTDGAGVYDIDQVARIFIDPLTGLITDETETSTTFSVVLTSVPAGNVNVGLSSSDTTEGTVEPTSMLFTPITAFTPQTATVTGVTDGITDGDQFYLVLTSPLASTDPAFDGVDPDDVSVVNLDVPTGNPGITVGPLAGLVTTEFGGTDTFSVELETVPSSQVTVTFDTSDPSEGSVDPVSVTFEPDITALNPQTLTVTGIGDGEADGDVEYTIFTNPATSSDSTYSGLDPNDVLVTNLDGGLTTLFETATLGTTGQGDGSGWQINAFTFLGAKFTITETIIVSNFGGHLVGVGADTSIFGAIVPLQGGTDFPANFTLSNAIVADVIDAPVPSNEASVTTFTELVPGRYAIIFGSGLFGATGAARMPGNDSDVGTPEYFFGELALPEWIDGEPDDARFFLVGGPETLFTGEIFSDGFESRDLTGWSATVP